MGYILLQRGNEMKPINYKYWFSFDHWTFEQAAYLFINIDPNDKEHITLINHVNYKKRHAGHFNSIDTFNEYLQLIKSTDFSKYDKDNALVGSVSLVAFFMLVKEKNLERFPSRLKREWENSPMNPNKPTTVPKPTAATKVTKASTEGYFGKETIDAFDSLQISGIANLFSTISPSWDTDKWKNKASKAKINGLSEARDTVTGGRAESTFNPVRVANWLISNQGSLPEHIERRLRKNLPDRSKGQEEDIFGID